MARTFPVASETRSIPSGVSGEGGSGSGSSTTPTAVYLHEQTLGSVINNTQDSLVAASMLANGIQIQLQDGAGSTPSTMANAVTWIFPLPVDIMGDSVGSTISLGQKLVQLAILERSVDTLPMNIGFAFGLIEGSDPNSVSGEGIALGIEYNSTTLRLPVHWRKVSGTWTRSPATTGLSTTFGVQMNNTRQGINNNANNKVIPLDSSFNNNTASGANVADAGNTVIILDAIDHMFIAAYWTSSGGGAPVSPTFVFDANIQIMPQIAHV